ncbi:MAG: endonuclease/exonuclease/phosphatase family protein [Steroidobacteraceae bacterium]
MGSRPFVGFAQRGGFGHPFRFWRTINALLLGLLSVTSSPLHAGEVPGPPAAGTLRIATYNASLYRAVEGQLQRELAAEDHPQIRAIAAVIQQARPDLLLINEFDFDERSPALFMSNYLARTQRGSAPIKYCDYFVAPSNTGIPSGLDLDRDGRIEGGNDALGFGRFPGHYGMLVLSNLPIDREATRTFRSFLWKDMPGALLPPGWYSTEALARLPLSSKSHWDVVIELPGNQRVHLLASHPTPPGFDGPENRNGRRNHDEIRLWADYLDPARGAYLVDDRGRAGALDPAAYFVILGDLNADPQDGGSLTGAIGLLLSHPRIHRDAALGTLTPRSRGAIAAAQRQGEQNTTHRSSSEFDTADFGDRGENSPGNLRVDYVLPSASLNVCASGVIWPENLSEDDPTLASDHRLVWVDVALPGSRCAN